MQGAQVTQEAAAVPVPGELAGDMGALPVYQYLPLILSLLSSPLALWVPSLLCGFPSLSSCFFTRSLGVPVPLPRILSPSHSQASVSPSQSECLRRAPTPPPANFLPSTPPLALGRCSPSPISVPPF